MLGENYLHKTGAKPHEPNTMIERRTAQRELAFKKDHLGRPVRFIVKSR